MSCQSVPLPAGCCPPCDAASFSSPSNDARDPTNSPFWHKTKNHFWLEASNRGLIVLFLWILLLLPTRMNQKICTWPSRFNSHSRLCTQPRPSFKCYPPALVQNLLYTEGYRRRLPPRAQIQHTQHQDEHLFPLTVHRMPTQMSALFMLLFHMETRKHV